MSTDTSNTSNFDNASIKQEIANIVGIENNYGWFIAESMSTTSTPQLHLLCQRPEADPVEYSKIRGMVVDVPNKVIVSKSFPYTESMVMPSIEAETADNYNMKRGYEGFLVHVFKHGGQVYFHTRKRLTLDRSRWGSSPTFAQMYQQVGGLTGDQLFDPTKQYSPYCHVFIVVHPAMLVCSKQLMQTGFLIYLGARQMWCPEIAPYPQDQVEMEATPVVTWPDTDMLTQRGPKGIFHPVNLTLEQANQHLTSGFHPGTNLGEFLILQNKTRPEDMLRVDSPAYNWRSQLRANEPNLSLRFYQLAGQIGKPTSDVKKLVQQLPLIKMGDIGDLILGGYPLTLNDPEFTLETVTPGNAALYNLWLNFLLAVPLVRQQDVFWFYDNFQNDRYDLIGFLYQLNDGTLDQEQVSELVQAHPRFDSLLMLAQNYAQDRKRTGRTMDRKGRPLSMKQLVKDNLRNLVLKEDGASLYRLVREMKRFRSTPTE